MTESQELSPQAEFDATYISASALCREIGCTRSTLQLAIEKGYIPPGISIGDGKSGRPNMTIFRRADVGREFGAWIEHFRAKKHMQERALERKRTEAGL